MSILDLTVSIHSTESTTPIQTERSDGGGGWKQDRK